MSKVAAELKYSTEHEWVASEGGGPSVIGVSAVATDALGDIVYVDLPEVGSTVTAGESCGEIESTKSVSELYSPVTGDVTEVNVVVADDPAVINADPYGAGWLFKVAVESHGPLLTAVEYAEINGLNRDLPADRGPEPKCSVRCPGSGKCRPDRCRTGAVLHSLETTY